MKRLHMHVSVDEFAHSIRFHSALLVAEPTERAA